MTSYAEWARVCDIRSVVKYPKRSLTSLSMAAPSPEKFSMFANRLAKVSRHLSRQASRQGITCFRLYDRDLPEFPLIIDRYGDRIQVAEYRSHHNLSEEEHAAWLDGSLMVVETTLGVPADLIYLKERKRKANREDQYVKEDDSGEFFNVTEGGLNFQVNLGDYLDTGLFPDHRITRALVRDAAGGKRVLNLFCYTGAFSVYAAAGGASEVMSVDLSKTYLEWARRNMALNGFTDPARYSFERADVLQFLPTLPDGYFDLVVLDPPTFSNSKKMQDYLDIVEDHAGMINTVLGKMGTGGLLYFSTNARHFVMDKASIHAASIRDITKATTPFDFEGKLRRWCYLLVK
jgi:23S rRNA (cytosine1962-C5)-methyltransferase